MIDSHIHLDSRAREELTTMATAGITAVVTLSYYPHINLPITSKTILDYFDRSIKFETWRGKQELIDVYIGISVNPVSVPPDYDKVLEAIPRYIADGGIVAVGEIGLEPGSQTCTDLDTQREITRAQLRIAKEHGLPVVFHTPHQEKPKWVDEYINMISQEKIDPDKVIIDHADASVTKKVTDSGCNAGISVQPWRGLRPVDAVSALKDCDLNKVLINSDCNITAQSDALSVPKTALEMKRAGLSQDDINKLVLGNAARIFNITQSY